MARCSWEAGIDITGGSQPEDDGFDLPQHEEQQQERSGWSRESSTFATPSRGDNSSWVPYPASGATWGADSDLCTDTPSQGSTNYPTYEDQRMPRQRTGQVRTPESSRSMYSPALSGPFISSQGDEESTYIDGSERLKPEALSISTASELYEGSIIMCSTDSTTMHTALESPMAYSSFLQSLVSDPKPSYAAPSAFEVGISTYDEDDERLRDSMSWTRASTYDERVRAEEDLINISSMDFSPTEQEHTAMHATLGHSPVSDNSWPDFYGMLPLPPPPPPQAQGPRMGLPFPLVPLKSSPATTTPFQSPPSPPAHSRRKLRSSSFFNPIRFAFPPRHPSPSPSVPTRRSAPSSPSVFSPLPCSPQRKSAGAEFAPQQPSPVQEHTRGRRRHRLPLRTARDWLFSGRFFAAAAA